VTGSPGLSDAACFFALQDDVDGLNYSLVRILALGLACDGHAARLAKRIDCAAKKGIAEALSRSRVLLVNREARSNTAWRKINDLGNSLS
jgi:hypothetical protein